MKPFYLKVCKNKNNARVWIEGKRLANMGFNRGDKILVSVFPEIARMTIGVIGKHYEQTDHADARTVSGRNRNGKELPIIDICCKELDFLKAFERLKISSPWEGLLVVDALVAEQSEVKTA